MAAAGDIDTDVDMCRETAEDPVQPCSHVSASSLQDGPTTSQMLSIKLDKLPLLESLCEKVEKNCCVKIRKDMRSAGGGTSASGVQWISISGSSGDCKDAGVRIFTFYSDVT